MRHGRERRGASRPGTGLRSVVERERARPRFRRAANRSRSATAPARALLQRPRQGGPATLHRSTAGRRTEAEANVTVGCASAHQPMARCAEAHPTACPPSASPAGSVVGALGRRVLSGRAHGDLSEFSPANAPDGQARPTHRSPTSRGGPRPNAPTPDPAQGNNTPKPQTILSSLVKYDSACRDNPSLLAASDLLPPDAASASSISRRRKASTRPW